MKIFRIIKAKIHKVPFRKEEWYNYSAMKTKQERKSRAFNHIVIFDENGDYISCPKIGGIVTYCHNGKLYKYKIVGFKNDSPNRDWLFYGDWINPIIEFVEAL